MTENWRVTVAVPKELEKKILELRKSDKYCRMSYSEIIRQMFELGLKAAQDEQGK